VEQGGKERNKLKRYKRPLVEEKSAHHPWRKGGHIQVAEGGGGLRLTCRVWGVIKPAKERRESDNRKDKNRRKMNDENRATGGEKGWRFSSSQRDAKIKGGQKRLVGRSLGRAAIRRVGRQGGIQSDQVRNSKVML